MDCFRKTITIIVVLALILSSIAVISQSDNADAMEPTYYDAEVSPFTFPECEGSPILNTFKQADKTIDISVYLLTSVHVLSLLMEKQSQGVNVRILIEGQPVEFDIGTYEGTKIFRNLIDKGGDVHIINYAGCTSQAYANLHNKYAVIDTETVIITSENWTASNFSTTSENRGWGAVIRSTEYAQYMETVFNNDFDESRDDVKKFTEVYPDLTPYTKELRYKIGSYTTNTYKAKVSPAVTFENATIQLETLVSSANIRLYVEQLNIADSFMNTPVNNPYAWMLAKAESGIDSRLVLNTYYDTPESHSSTDKVKSINDNTPIIASGSPQTHSLIHNKGLVVDDKVWVGSMNWTPESINDTRETNVIIMSQEVSDFYARAFLLDLYSGYIPGGGKEVSRVTYEVEDESTVLTHIKGDKVILPDEPVKKSESIHTYSFSHWEGYTDGMVADKDIALNAVFDEHTALGDNVWYVYLVAVLAGIGAIALGAWYVRNRN